MPTHNKLDKGTALIACSGDRVDKPDFTLREEEGDRFETQLSIDHGTSRGVTKARDTLAQGNLHLLQLSLKGSRKGECIQAIQDTWESNVPPDRNINTNPIRNKVTNIPFKELSLASLELALQTTVAIALDLCRTSKYQNSHTSSSSLKRSLI